VPVGAAVALHPDGAYVAEEDHRELPDVAVEPGARELLTGDRVGLPEDLQPLEGHLADLCAAPGGKTAQLAHAGARVTAVDRSPGRIARLQDNLTRLSLQAETVVADATEWTTGETFDGVLVDAPCAATGTIRRHPDVAWLKHEADINALAALQRRLLQKAVALLKPGGTLVYCTCSLEPEEGEQAIEALLASDTTMRRAPVEAAEVGGLADIITAQGDLRTLPCHLPNPDPRLAGLDGFYAARLVKA
jgi:16S rRNA (cytosine967-C5)-methyltransferase